MVVYVRMRPSVRMRPGRYQYTVDHGCRRACRRDGRACACCMRAAVSLRVRVNARGRMLVALCIV